MFEKTVHQVKTADLDRFRALDVAKASDADKKDARALLDGLAVKMVSENGQSIRPGNLRIYAGQDGVTHFALKQFSRNTHNDQANELVRKLVAIGYADHPKGATEALDQYLNTSGQKMGSQSLFKLVKSHNLHQRNTSQDEAMSPGIEAADWRRGGFLQREARIGIGHLTQDVDANTHTQVQQTVEQPVQPLEPSYVMPSTKEELQQERINTFASAGVQVEKSLGKGAGGEAFQATLDGQQVVIKTNAKAMPFTLDRLARVDRYAAAGNIGHSVYLGTPSKNFPDFKTDKIVAPTHYLVRRSNDRAPELMTAVQARDFLKTERAGVRIARCEGEIMPMAKGEPGLKAINKRLNDATQAKLFIEMLEMGRELQGRGLLHRDLKPENMFIDPQTGKIQVFDWDFAYKISSQKSPSAVTPELAAGTQLFRCPKVAQGAGYAGEADMHSVGMIMLNARYPRVFDDLVSPVAEAMRFGAANLGPSAFQSKLIESAGSIKESTRKELDRLTGVKSYTEKALAETEEKLAHLDHSEGTGQAASVAQVQNRVDQRDQLENRKANLMKSLESVSKKIPFFEGRAEEISRFLQEASDDQIAHSLTGVALECVKLANEEPTSKWISRPTAQAYYRQVLAHPALAEAQLGVQV